MTDAHRFPADRMPSSELPLPPHPFARAVSSRLVQLLGNVVKAVCTVHVRIAPRARFTLPRVSRPLWRNGRARRIPRIVWQTNYTDRVTLAVYVNWLWNRLMAPTHEHRVMLDDDCLAYIRANFPEDVLRRYQRINIGAGRADLWRVLAMLHEGGLYLDIDAAFDWPADGLLANDPPELLIRNKDGMMTNYFMACEPGNPTMQAILDRILANIDEGTLTSVYDLTGPTVLDAVADRPGVVIDASRGVSRQAQFTSKHLQYPDRLRGYWVEEEKRSRAID